MRKTSLAQRLPVAVAPALVLCGLTIVFYLTWQALFAADVQIAPAPFWFSATALSGVCAWAALRWANVYKERNTLRDRLQELQERLPETQRRLDAILQLNRSLVDAQDEKALMDMALGVIARLVAASSVTFVPMDEWGQPLSAFTYGNLPEAMLKAWAEHLASERVRQRCRVCESRRAPAGTACPTIAGAFAQTASTYCLPLNLGERMLGMLNVHLPPDVLLDEEELTFLEAVLNEIGPAVQAIRLRNQELNTLRQLQMLRASKADLTLFLESLLEGLQRSLGVEFVLLNVIKAAPWQTGVQVQKGFSTWLEPETVEQMHAQVLSSGRLYGPESGGLPPAKLSTELATPLTLPDGRVIGSLLVASKRPLRFGDHEVGILQKTAAQAALLVENERMFLTLEYNAVIRERIRLAREIHDGLAQTLAFLKMKTSQMQSFLSQGDFTRLSQVLQQNYQALAEAYLDTRQAIDNLRLTPQPGLVHWLEQLIADFEAGSGLKVERRIEPAAELAPEVQAQLIRIVQEALSNIRKHARAKQVWVAMQEFEGDLIVEVRDDGRGFNPEDVPELSQYGLRGMRERAEFIGADFQITSHFRQGTIVRLRLPHYEEALT